MEQRGGALPPCMVATPWTRAHYVEHVAGDERGMVGGALGWIWAESGHGPNTKIEARTKLYVFHQGGSAISKTY